MKTDYTQTGPTPRTAQRRWLAPASLALLTLALSGCLGGARYQEEVVVLTPEQAARLEKAETKRVAKAQARVEYDRNRPVPPEQYSVMPRRRGDNSFGEFTEERFDGLDVQPELPPLPQERSVPGPGPAPSPFVPGGSYAGASVVDNGPPVAAPLAPPAAEPVRPRRSGQGAAIRPAGIRSGAQFYPVEQLVYGGEHPDLDKPELYRLMPKDVVTVTVKDHPEFSGQLQIQPDGTVRIPNTPDLTQLRGLTAEEAAGAVRATIAGYIKGETKVRVQANRARGGYYYVFGDVLQPGRFPMGIEPIRLSEAVLAANWEANPTRLDADGDDLGPSFPAAAPRGRYVAPPTADLAGVVLITPHRSQPARSVHDARAALMGMRGEDPLIRPGQIIVVPSLDPERNQALGLDVAVQGAPQGMGGGFATASGPARLPDYLPPAPRRSGPAQVITPRQANMEAAFDVNMNTETEFDQPEVDGAANCAPAVAEPFRRPTRMDGWQMGF